MKKNAVTVLASAWVAVLLFSTSPVFAADKDNNPPGPAGGKGTNWENPPGPEGGRGASPDKKHYGLKKKADQNHDGVLDETEKAQAKEILEKRHEKREEKREEKKEAWKAKADKNGDGTVDKVERHEAKEKFKKHHDRDNNPPGPKGGKGTNWENPKGPKGGPGASPDKH